MQDLQRTLIEPEDRRRARIAAVTSVVLHALAVLALMWLAAPPGQWGGPDEEEEMMALNLVEAAAVAPRYLVDAGAPADQPVPPTNRIARQDALSRAPERVDADQTGVPLPEAPMDTLPSPPPASPAAPPVAPAPPVLPAPPSPRAPLANGAPPEPEPDTAPEPDSAPAPDSAPDSETDTAPRPAPTPPAQDLSELPPVAPAPQADAPSVSVGEPATREAPAPTPEPPEETPPRDERMQVAQARPPQPAQPPVPPSTPQAAQAPSPRAAAPSDTPPRAGRSRVQGQAMNRGVLSFEANRDEIAEYLTIVRDRVERAWTAMLATRYQGTQPTRAVIDCVIAPDGRLLEARIVESGERIFAGLSQRALQDAGPFPPFPFEVPDLYRTNNIEIRWTFSYL